MRILFILAGLPLIAAIGDNAPPLPATYVTAHPRLPYPDNAFLDAIYNGGTPIARYTTAATDWVASDPAANGGLMAFRRLAILYLAYKRNNPGHANTGTYLSKLKDLANNAGLWAARTYYVSDLSGSGSGLCTSCTVVTVAGNFLTGCGGGSCAGGHIAILAREYTISSVSGDGKTLTLSGGSYIAPNGSGMTGAVSSGEAWGNYDIGLAVSLLYDWVYDDLATAERDRLRAVGVDLCTQYQINFDNNGPSPFNDNFWLTQSMGLKQTQELVVALAFHDPDNATHKAATLFNLRHAMDVWLNIKLPVWRLVIGNGGKCGAGTDSSTGCGGAWHEGWSDYVAETWSGRKTMANWYLTYALSWASASGRGSSFYTADEPWIKNFAYWTMYNTRPDFSVERIGAVSFGTLAVEGTGYTSPAMGVLSGLAEMYNDPTLRGWAKTVNWRDHTFDEFEPSAWPYFTPLKASPTNTRSSLSPFRDFPGVGTIYFRTGFGEDDTACYLRYAPFNFWSHPVQDAGSWACYHRGALAIRSGTYRAGEISPHFWQYTAQAVAHNTITIYDSGDRYAGETYEIQNDGVTTQEPMPNDGGQRRVGSRMGVPDSPSAELQGKQHSPTGVEEWLQSHEYYKGGKLAAFTIGASNKYAFASIDITDTYNNVFSAAAHATDSVAREANSVNRSYRAQLVRRHFLFIPRGAAAYVVLYDQVVSTNSAFTKKNLVHFVNNPNVTAWDGNRAYWDVSRAETVTGAPFPDLWLGLFHQNITHCPSGCSSGSTQYVYAGKMYGFMTLPSGGSITEVTDFNITDSAGTVNYNGCMDGQCPTGYGLGSVEDEISSDPNSGPNEVGGYRIEQSPASASKEDWFLNVMLFTTASDTNVVSTLPSTTLSGGNYTTTWQDASNTCTYTVVLPQYGVGGSITATGAGCVVTI